MGTTLRIVAIVVVSCCIAAGFNAARNDEHALSWKTDVAAIIAEEEGKQALTVGEASVEDVRAAIVPDEATGQCAVVIDSRDPESFARGHLAADPACYPGVINVHVDNVFEVGPLLLDYIAGRQIILYCTSETCDLAERVAVQLKSFGFPEETMSIYKAGWDGIRKHGLPTAAGECIFLLEIGAGDPSMMGDPYGEDPYGDPTGGDFDDGDFDDTGAGDTEPPDFSGLPEPGEG